MARKLNLTTPRASKKARVATNAENQASSSHNLWEVTEEASGFLEETLTDKTDAKKESVTRPAAQDRKLQVSEADDDESEDHGPSEFASHSNAGKCGREEQGDESTGNSVFPNDVSDDPSDMQNDMWDAVHRPDTPDPFALSEDEEMETADGDAEGEEDLD